MKAHIDIVIPRSGYLLEAQPLKIGRPHGDKRNEPCRRTRQGLGVPAYVDGFHRVGERSAPGLRPLSRPLGTLSRSSRGRAARVRWWVWMVVRFVCPCVPWLSRLPPASFLPAPLFSNVPVNMYNRLMSARGASALGLRNERGRNESDLWCFGCKTWKNGR